MIFPFVMRLSEMLTQALALHMHVVHGLAGCEL
jgi:hypothetical protein